VAAWLVHAYTALGALLAFLSLRDAVAGDFRMSFLWLVIATAIDSTDGVLARLAHVKRYAANLDGAHLDDIVDYLTFVFVPALIVYYGRLVPDLLALPVIAAMLLSSAFGFTLDDAKTEDQFFTGFPSYWNIVVLYMVALQSDLRVNAAMLFGFAALVFVRVGYIYPSRTPTWKAVTLPFGALWAAAMVVVVWTLPNPPRSLVITSLAFPVYYFVLSLMLQRRRRR
jgi:phosphatidylcholine synthase